MCVLLLQMELAVTQLKYDQLLNQLAEQEATIVKDKEEYSLSYAQLVQATRERDEEWEKAFNQQREAFTAQVRTAVWRGVV